MTEFNSPTLWNLQMPGARYSGMGLGNPSGRLLQIGHCLFDGFRVYAVVLQNADEPPGRKGKK